MSGSLTLPTILAALAGGNQNVSLIDGDLSAIVTYLNAREITQDVVANRPAAGTAGRWFYATDTGILYADTGSAWTQLAPSTKSNFLAETLTGLGLTRTSGTALTVAVGACTSEDAVIANRVLMSLTSATQGNTAGTWVVGNNQNKLDAGAIGTTQTWHVFVIERVDTAVVDILFSQSATAPTLPTNYTKQRRIGSFRTDGAAAILAFVQYGDEFYWTTPPALDVDATNPGTAAVTRTLTVPTGVQMLAIVNVVLVNATNNNVIVYLSSLDAADVAASLTASPLGSVTTSAQNANGATGAMARVWTNTSGQIRSRLSVSGANDILRMATAGWLDRRGRG